MSNVKNPPAKASKSGLAQLAPLESTNLHQQAYAQLRQAIMSGKFEPGETLTLRRLAAALGTSVMPARDAVLRLIAERALEPEGRSVRVPVMTLGRLQDVTRMRLALEGEAAMLAAERATPAEIAAMKSSNAAAIRAQSSGRMAKFLTANEEFHFAVYRGAHSELLTSLIESLWLQVGPYLGYLVRAESDTAVLAADLSSHATLIEAIERRDPEAARAALVADLKDANDIYRPFSASAPETAAAAAPRSLRGSRRAA